MKKMGVVCGVLAALLLSAAGRPAVKAVLFPFREAVIAARVDSALEPYQFKLGEAFTTGDVLVTLDRSRYAIEEKRAREQYDFAKANYENKQQLRAKNFASNFELKKAEYDFHQAENTLADAQLNISFCTVKAPFAGKIVEFLTREYETTRPGQPLFRIIDDNQLLAVMNVPINDKALSSVGNAVAIAIAEENLTASGRIYEVAPQADHRTGTVRIRVLIDNAAGRFKASMTGELVYGQ